MQSEVFRHELRGSTNNGRRGPFFPAPQPDVSGRAFDTEGEDVDCTTLTSSSIDNDWRQYSTSANIGKVRVDESERSFGTVSQHRGRIHEETPSRNPADNIYSVTATAKDSDIFPSNFPADIHRGAISKSAAYFRMPLSSHNGLANLSKTSTGKKKVEEKLPQDASKSPHSDATKPMYQKQPSLSYSRTGYVGLDAEHDQECQPSIVGQGQCMSKVEASGNQSHGWRSEEPVMPHSPARFSSTGREPGERQTNDHSLQSTSTLEDLGSVRPELKSCAKRHSVNSDDGSASHLEEPFNRDREPLKRSRSLDYEIEELEQMSYQDLQHETFDHDPKSQGYNLPAKLASGSVHERLNHLFMCRQKDLLRKQGAPFFASLKITEYEECGDLIINRLKQIMDGFKNVRREKRQACEAFENEIDSRQELVRARREMICADMKIMQQKGKDIVPTKIR